MEGFAEILKTIVPVLAPGWPGRELEVPPGDFSRFIPQGFGLGAPVVLRPWDVLDAIGRRGSYYGFDSPNANPLANAPTTEPAGGVIYFDSRVEAAALDGAIDAMGIYAELDDFATFAATASNRAVERYLDQIRIVSSMALRGLFGISAEDPLPRPAQPVSIRQLVHRFVELERQRWGSGYSVALAGTLGGDGDWAKESLAFGLLVENTYWGVYRLWSRPWLVTK